MVACWQYTPENRINFHNIHSRLNEILLDKNNEQPSIWFSNETTSQTVNKKKNLSSISVLHFYFL